MKVKNAYKRGAEISYKSKSAKKKSGHTSRQMKRENKNTKDAKNTMTQSTREKNKRKLALMRKWLMILFGIFSASVLPNFGILITDTFKFVGIVFVSAFIFSIILTIGVPSIYLVKY